MFDRTRCGVELGDCKKHDCVHFTCPQCGAQHDRGFVGGNLGRFRCLRCGYSGHGLHPDVEIDEDVFVEWQQGNATNRVCGAPELPFTFPDPRSGPG